MLRSNIFYFFFYCWICHSIYIERSLYTQLYQGTFVIDLGRFLTILNMKELRKVHITFANFEAKLGNNEIWFSQYSTKKKRNLLQFLITIKTYVMKDLLTSKGSSLFFSCFTINLHNYFEQILILQQNIIVKLPTLFLYHTWYLSILRDLKG